MLILHLTQHELEDIRLCVASYLNSYDDMIFPELYDKICFELKKLEERNAGLTADKGLLE